MSALPLAGLWLALLLTAWTVTLSVAITPLVVPALIGVSLLVRLIGTIEATLSRSLLRVHLSPHRGPAVSGFWRRAWAVVADRWVWKAQAYVILRVTLGFAIAASLTALVAGGLFLATAPIFYWAIPNGIDVGLYRVHTFAESLPLVPVGVAVLVLTGWLIGPLCVPWRILSVTLLGGDHPQQPRSMSANSRPVAIHAGVAAAVSLVLIAIWAITSLGYFWPIWPILLLGLALAIHAWVTFVEERPALWDRYRLNSGFAIHAGVWVALLLFLTGIWAASGGGYFWPVWVLLIALLASGIHLAVVLASAPDRAALTERISSLEESRAGAVDVQDAELRRIERDLHDGAQARLVALGMSLGMAEQKLDTDAAAARELLADARAGAGEALRELRDLARGIHPPVLADRGLDAAVRALAAVSPISVTVSAVLAERPKAPVESAAYFVVAEALANAGKYAQASRVDVRIAQAGEVISVEVHDDGRGGADPAGGGLSGLRRRVEALDGTLSVISPAGGPTTIRAELPCG